MVISVGLRVIMGGFLVGGGVDGMESPLAPLL